MESSEPVKPGEFVEHVEIVELVKPAEPVELVEPTYLVKLVGPVELVQGDCLLPESTMHANGKKPMSAHQKLAPEELLSVGTALRCFLLMAALEC